MQIEIPFVLVALVAYLGLGALFFFCVSVALFLGTLQIQKFFKNRDLWSCVVLHTLLSGRYPADTVRKRLGGIAAEIREENPELYEQLRRIYWQSKTERPIQRTLDAATHTFSQVEAHLLAQRARHPEIYDPELESLLAEVRSRLKDVQKPLVS